MPLAIQNVYPEVIRNERFNLLLLIYILHPYEYTHRLHYCPFPFNLYRCVGSCNTLNDLSNSVCYKQNRRFKSKHFQHDYRSNESETLTKHISCECKCKFDGRKCNSNQDWNNDKC